LSKAKSKKALKAKINALNKQIEVLIKDRDALLRLYIGDVNEIIIDAEYTVVDVDGPQPKRTRTNRNRIDHK
jgi:hypothetical protein